MKLLKANPTVGAFGALAEEQNVDHTDADAGQLKSFFSFFVFLLLLVLLVCLVLLALLVLFHGTA